MREYYKEKVKNLISLRASLFTIVVVLTGGIIGLFFMNVSLIKILPLAIIGVYYDFVFVSNIFSINNKIDVLLEGLIK